MRSPAVFGQIKFDRRIDRFRRIGRGAVLSESRLATTTHNVPELDQQRIAAAT
jgi:hypothetical protein